MHATVRIPEDELVYEPGVLVLPHGGDARARAHQRRQEHPLRGPAEQRRHPVHLAGEPLEGHGHLELDGPGYYWYGSTTGNDEGRGLTGAIVVSGDAPPEARLDRPPQPRP